MSAPQSIRFRALWDDETEHLRRGTCGTVYGAEGAELFVFVADGAGEASLCSERQVIRLLACAPAQPNAWRDNANGLCAGEEAGQGRGAGGVKVPCTAGAR